MQLSISRTLVTQPCFRYIRFFILKKIACFAGFLKEQLRNAEKKNIFPFSLAPGKDVEENNKRICGNYTPVLNSLSGFLLSPRCNRRDCDGLEFYK